MIREIKYLENQIQETFGPVVKTAHDAWKTALSARDMHLKPCQNAEKIIRQHCSAYLVEQDRIKSEAERKAREEAEAAQEAERKRLWSEGERKKALELKSQPIIVASQPKVDAGEGIKRKKVWKFRIVDANQIPREYLDINETKIRKVVNALGSQTNIPGIQVYEESQIAVGKAIGSPVPDDPFGV